MTKSLVSLLALVVAAPLWGADFTPLDRAAARSLTDASKYRQPTIVALWSSDCTHCKKNLHLFADLAKTDRRLKVVSVAAEPESPDVRRLLDGTRLPGERYVYGDDAPEALAYALDPTWRGELPRTFLFDGKGGKAAISGALDQAAVKKALGIGGKAL